MNIINYDISGQVIESGSGKGIYNLRVEVWDKDIKYNDLLGEAVTNENGGFTISFDSTYFREFARDDRPDIFFKVYQGRKLLKTTEDAPIFNAETRVNTTIRINMPAMRAAGRDRVTALQMFKAAEFFQQSDFKGVYNDFRSRAGTSLGFISDMVVNTITQMDIEPVKAKRNRGNDVIGQDVASARQNLAAKKVEVNEIKPYNPRLDAESFSEITAFSSVLKPGQKVNLYEENGKIRYLSIVKEQNYSSEKNSELVETQKQKIEHLEKELASARQNSEQKEKQFNKMQQEMDTLRRDHDEIRNLLKPENIARMLQNLQKQEQPKEEKEIKKRKRGGSENPDKNPNK